MPEFPQSSCVCGTDNMPFDFTINSSFANSASTPKVLQTFKDDRGSCHFEKFLIVAKIMNCNVRI